MPEEIEVRIAFAEQELLQTTPPALVMKHVMEKWPEVGRGAAALAVQRAMISMTEDVIAQLPYYRGLVVNRLQMEIAASVAKQKYRDAIAGEAELSKVLGLRAPMRLQVSGDNSVRDAISKVVSSMSQSDRDQMVEEQLELERKAKLAGMNGHSKIGDGHG
jgi:hypothetical protein